MKKSAMRVAAVATSFIAAYILIWGNHWYFQSRVAVNSAAFLLLLVAVPIALVIANRAHILNTVIVAVVASATWAAIDWMRHNHPVVSPHTSAIETVTSQLWIGALLLLIALPLMLGIQVRDRSISPAMYLIAWIAFPFFFATQFVADRPPLGIHIVGIAVCSYIFAADAFAELRARRRFAGGIACSAWLLTATALFVLSWATLYLE